MAKITIEYDDASMPGVTQSLSAAPSASITDAEAGAAPGESSPNDAPGSSLFERFRDDAEDAGGPPEWLFKAIAGSAETLASAPGIAGDDATDGGSAPEL